MQPSVGFWHDLNASLRHAFVSYAPQVYISDADAVRVLDEHFADFERLRHYKLYDDGITVREIQLVFENDLVIANFVHQSLQRMADQIMPGDPDLHCVKHAITLIEPEDRKYIVKVTAAALLFFVRAAQVRINLLHVDLLIGGGPRCVQDLIPGYLDYAGPTHMRVNSAFRNLQVGNAPSGTNMLEINMAQYLGLFRGGTVNRSLPDVTIGNEFVREYMQMTRQTCEDLFGRVRALRQDNGLGTNTQLSIEGEREGVDVSGYAAEEEEDDGVVNAGDEFEVISAAQLRARANGGVWIASDRDPRRHRSGCNQRRQFSDAKRQITPAKPYDRKEGASPRDKIRASLKRAKGESLTSELFGEEA